MKRFDSRCEKSRYSLRYSHLIEAVQKNIPIITEVEVATSVMQGHLIGLTGTNGKTTTTSMIQEMLSIADKEGTTYALGNIGIPASQVALSH